jgi:VanZ family protein
MTVSRRLLLVWLLCIIAGTLAPYDFGAAPTGQGGALHAFATGSYEQDPMHFAFNLLMFVPLGALLHHEARRRAVSLPVVMLLAGTAGLLISSAVEYAQVFLPSRDSSLIDVLANTTGALIGVTADITWGGLVEASVSRLRTRTSSAVLVGLMTGLLAVALLLSGALQRRTQLSNWSLEYPLLIGNERTGDRPWRGRVFALTMTDAAMPLASVRRFSEGESVVLPGSPIAQFDLTGAAPYRDSAGYLPNLEWTERQDTSIDAGVELPRPWLHSEGTAAALVRRLGKTNAFTLRVRCVTDDPDQQGPARVVSNSASPLLRNFTMGQQGGDLVFRLRTPSTGVNGYPLEVSVPDVFSDLRPHEILVTYDGATLLVAMANSDRVSRTALMPGPTAALAIPFLDVKPAELPMYELAYVAALSLVPAVLVAVFGHTRRHRYLLGAGWGLAFAVLLEATLVGVSGRAFDWKNVAITAAVAAVVLTLVGLALVPADVPSRPPARAWRFTGAGARAS